MNDESGTWADKVGTSMGRKIIDRNSGILGGTPVSREPFLNYYSTVTRKQAVALLEEMTAQLVRGVE